jgi:hypothetical protein
MLGRFLDEAQVDLGLREIQVWDRRLLEGRLGSRVVLGTGILERRHLKEYGDAALERLTKPAIADAQLRIIPVERKPDTG